MEKHSVSRLIGGPPGYVGYEEGGLRLGQVEGFAEAGSEGGDQPPRRKAHRKRDGAEDDDQGGRAQRDQRAGHVHGLAQALRRLDERHPVLRLDLHAIAPDATKLVANLPYNVATPIVAAISVTVTTSFPPEALATAAW